MHVKQHHTVDIILTEIICILNWYNPFAWLLRHAVRQNLEFIADSHVIQSGVDKKDYQYLLLKVIGTPQFRLANQFNFSSLKKRIVMINKIPSAKAQWVKFLLAVPLVTVILLIFRSNVQEQNRNESVTIYGLVLDGGRDMNGMLPIEGASVTDINSNTTAVTDDRGYYSLTIPAKEFPLKTELVYIKYGFKVISSKTNYLSSSIKAPMDLKNITLPTLGSRFKSDPDVHNISLNESNILDHASAPYKNARFWVEQNRLSAFTSFQLQHLITTSEHPFWSLNELSNLYDRDGNSVGTAEYTDIVYVDGMRMTGEEVNQTIKRSDVVKVDIASGKKALEKYGINGPVFELYIYTRPEPDMTVMPSFESN